MKLFDLTRPMNHQTLVDLGGRRAEEGSLVRDIEVRWLRDWQQGDNTSQCQWFLSDHFGTHIDAPVHVIDDGASVDELDISRLVGDAVVIDCSFACGRGLTDTDFERTAGLVRRGDIVLIYSAERPGRSDSFITDQTYVTPEGAEWLVRSGVVAVGVEAAGFENVYQRVVVEDCYRPEVENPWPAHRICLASDVYIIEGLTNLAPIVGRRVSFSALPLPIPRSSGSPVRAVAWVP